MLPPNRFRKIRFAEVFPDGEIVSTLSRQSACRTIAGTAMIYPKGGHSMITFRITADIKDDHRVVLTLPPEVPTG